MKYIKQGFLLIILVLSCCACNNDDKYLKEINYKKFAKKIENKETFFVEVVQTGCSFCQSFTPKLKSVLKEYKITGYQINLTTMSEEDYNLFNNEFNVKGTPATIFITEGKEISILQRIDGNKDKETIISKLKSNGYIKNDSN